MILFTNRYLKKLLLFVVVTSLVALPVQLSAGTTGKISGKVLDAKTGEPLVGANILILSSNQGAATDEDGVFYILNIPPGTISVRASMVGYSSVLTENVRISADKTTNLNFSLSDVSLQSEEVVITATRPLVEKDVGASQAITTTREASLMPVSDIMDAVSLEPGIVVTENRMEVSIRGGGSDQISFQVDGMERTDKLNNKTYTPTNSATVEEIQVLKGGFNAEYGNLRSGMFNVVTKSGGSKFSGSADYRMAPGQQKHFGPNAYGTDQYDYKVYGGANSFEQVKDIEGNVLFIGWDALAVTRNGESYKGKSDWTPQQLQEVWKYQHRPIEYGESPDHYLDFGLSGPIGLENSGFLLGVKYNRIQPIFPTIRGYDQILSYEGKLNFQLSQSMNLMVSGLYGENETSTNGDTWGNQGVLNYGYDVQSTSNPAISTDSKYYLAFNNPMDVSTSQIGFKFTHTLNQSTFYELRYTYFTTDSETSNSTARSTAGVKTIGGVEFDEGPVGWVHTSESLRDITGTYAFSGGGRVEDVSSAKSHLINFDMTSQVTDQHMLKFGLMFSSDNLIKDYYGASTIILDPDAGDFVNFENSPYQISGYVQDKIEYGGLIANIGLRVEHYAANGDVYDPGNLYSPLWARGGTAGYESPDDLPSEKSKSYTYLAPRISFSHPVQEFTKFFFNFGVYYSEPTTLDRYGLYSESWAFGNPAGDIRRLGYPNLEPAKTSAYEVGFEQVIGNDWLIRAYFYSKDNSQQIGDVRFNGLDGTGYTGTFINYASSGGAASYNSKRNSEYETIRGIEMKVTKRMGRFFTGWINMNYAISTSGNYGISNYNQDPLAASLVYAATKQQPQTTPGIIANFNVHTPAEFGKLWGQWSLSVNQFWTAGSKYFYNPTNLPTREIKTIYYWVDNFLTNLRLSKFLEVTDFLNARIYLDVRNVFDFEALNLSGLDSREQDSYFINVVDPESGLGNDIGEVEDKNGNNVFSENWVDKDGNNRAPIAPTKDFALSLNPRSFLIGIKLEF